MKLVRPHFNERKELVVFEFENEHIQGLVNGFLFAILTLGPIVLVVRGPEALLGVVV